MKKLVHQWFWPDVLIVFLLCFLLPFFFFNLGLSSLVSWDEAWYAEIARNIIKSGDIFNLTWNQMAYYDHPPVGFWLIAIGEILFGYSEFGYKKHQYKTTSKDRKQKRKTKESRRSF
jgi:4-amino-4-deoxy-L-arabinose transferase